MWYDQVVSIIKCDDQIISILNKKKKKRENSRNSFKF